MLGLAGMLAALACGPPAEAQRPLNLGFEMPGAAGPGRPWGWAFGWSAFAGGPQATFALDGEIKREGRFSLRIAMPDSGAGAPPQVIQLQVPAHFARGRSLTLTGWVRSAGLRGRALLTLEAWKFGEFAAADTAALGDGGPNPRTSAWTRHALSIHVPDDEAVHSIVVGAALEGVGSAWFDDLSLEVEGKPIAELPPTAPAPTRAELSWLAAHAATLRDVQPPAGAAVDDSDLDRFRQIVGDARIVGLGESTHGTREFFLVKHRLLEHLVRRMDFRVFAIEANQLAVERVNAYVQGGEGTARQAMRVMFAVWNTEEMEALIDWIRAHNLSHPGREVRVVGYDMQDHRRPADTLRAYLARVESELLPRFDALAGEYRAERGAATPQRADSTRGRWHAQIESLWEQVSGRRAAWLARATDRSDTLAAEWAVQSANLLRQAARFNVALSSPERDSLMAANLDWALRTLAPGARAAVWAHDVHVSRGGDSKQSFNAGAQMGAFVRRIHGDGYRAFSLLTYDGDYSATASFNDHRMIVARGFAAPAGSIEHALHALGAPRGGVGVVVDLRPARAGAEAAWLRRPRPIRHVGYAAYDYAFELEVVAPLEFDGIVFVDRTTASRVLR